MPEVADKSAWVRLGRLLEQRRVTMDPRYSNLSLFAEERGINYRMAWDAEQAKRTNYRHPTRLAIDVAYGWQPGSVDRVLRGRDPVVLAKEEPPIPEDAPVCTFEESILSEDGISLETKSQLIRVHRLGRHANCRPLEEGEPRVPRSMAR